MRILFAIPCLLLAFSAPATPPQDARVEAMKKLDLFVGEWKGTGKAAMGPKERFEFRQVERVERRVGGTVLLVEGKSTRTNDAGEEVVTHDGLALLYFDDKTGRYRWHGHDTTSGAIDAEAVLIDGGFQWRIENAAQGATIRFTIRFDEHRWTEVGEASTDGKTWNAFMETTLERQG